MNIAPVKSARSSAPGGRPPTSWERLPVENCVPLETGARGHGVVEQRVRDLRVVEKRAYHLGLVELDAVDVRLG